METIKPIFLQVLIAVVLISLGGSLEAANDCSLIRSATPPAGPAEIPASV